MRDRCNKFYIRILSVSLTAICLLSLPIFGHAALSVSFAKTRLAGVCVNIVTADLNDPNVSVTPAIPKWGIGTCESFRSLIRRTRPAAAVDGTFFCTRSLKPTGDIVIDGQLLWKGYLGTAISVNGGNRVRFVPSRSKDLYRWYDYDQVLAAGPTLIRQGRTIVMPKTEGFRSGVHFTRRARAAVGLTYNNKLIFVTTRQRIYLSQLARVMKRLKCADAAVLDGGSSIGLYCKGKLITNPGRGMTNCLLVYDDPASHERRRSSLYPSRQYTKAESRGT